MLLADVSVALSRADRRVPEKLLDHTDVGAVPQEQCGDGMAQHMRGHPLVDAGLVGQPGDDVGGALGRQWTLE